MSSTPFNPSSNANANGTGNTTSPTLEQAPNRDAYTARQRNVRILDEEKAEGHYQDHNITDEARSPGTESQKRRRLHEVAHALRFEENAEELQRFWDQFTRKGKRQIGVKESLRALLYSSCAYRPFLL